LATGAVYTFTSFSSHSARHLYLHHDRYPTGAAFRFASAQRAAADVTGILAAFQRTQPQAESLTSPVQAADAEYHYRVHLLPGSAPHLAVVCWRRSAGGGCWIPYCGPMTMAAFIQRFWPRDER
jgi:hypothetical protein